MFCNTFKRLKHNKAFSLAEVLLVLTIIGVIASLTIPDLIVDMQKQELYSRFTVAYQALDQAATMIVEDYGGDLTNQFPYGASNIDTNELLDAFASKLITIKKCYSGDANDCWTVPDVIDMLNGDPIVTSFYYWDSRDTSMILANGTQIRFLYRATAFPSRYACNGGAYSFKGQNAFCIPIHLDTNGDKPPNQLGRDIFQLLLYKYGIVGMGFQGTATAFDYTQHPELCTTDCVGGGCAAYSGLNCPARLLLEGEMNY